jgi:predicted DNA-binding transcriptional regulator AlpA
MGKVHAADTADRLLRTQEVATWLAVSKSTLVRWRQSLQGPDVYWLADGVPRYRASDVERWLTGRSAARPRAPRLGSAHAGPPR